MFSLNMFFQKSFIMISFLPTITFFTINDTVFFVVALKVVQSLRCHITKHI